VHTLEFGRSVAGIRRTYTVESNVLEPNFTHELCSIYAVLLGLLVLRRIGEFVEFQ